LLDFADFMMHHYFRVSFFVLKLYAHGMRLVRCVCLLPTSIALSWTRSSVSDAST